MRSPAKGIWNSLHHVRSAVYDALLARCALKAGSETIYTWNTKHFSRLGAEVASRVKSS